MWMCVTANGWKGICCCVAHCSSRSPTAHNEPIRVVRQLIPVQIFETSVFVSRTNNNNEKPSHVPRETWEIPASIAKLPYVAKPCVGERLCKSIIAACLHKSMCPSPKIYIYLLAPSSCIHNLSICISANKLQKQQQTNKQTTNRYTAILMMAIIKLMVGLQRHRLY